MLKKLSKGKIVAIVIGVVAVVLAGVGVTGVVINTMAGPGEGLPETYVPKNLNAILGTEENPYTILEVVPDTDSATVGYLIKEQEPIDLQQIGMSNKDDEGSAANIYNQAFGSEESKSSNVDEYTKTHIFESDNVVGASDVKSDPGAIKSSLADGEGYFSEFGYYTRDDNGNYAYNTSDPSNKYFEPVIGVSSSYERYTWTSLGEFKYVGAGNVKSGVACSREVGEEESPRSYSYSYSNNKGTSGSKAYNYYYTPFGEFQWVPNNEYNNENIFIENQVPESDTGVAIGTKVYMTRTENMFYEYMASNITCNDTLIKEIVGNPKITALDYKTQVVTVTPAILNNDPASERLINTADMIIIHDDSTGFRIKYAFEEGAILHDSDCPKFIKGSGYVDLNDTTVNRLIDRGAGPNIVEGSTVYPAAIVFDEDAIKDADANGCSNLKLVYDVYNNMGAKLAYNTSGNNYVQKNRNMKSDPSYRNFGGPEEGDALGKSHFVYNNSGEEFWLGRGIANKGKIHNTEKTAPAFDNVNLDGNVDKAYMSLAQMLAAINYESNGGNQPEKLTVLELQPNNNYIYNQSSTASRDNWIKYYLSIIPWFVGSSKTIDADFTVETMPTYEFIGKNDDINEKYNLIVIGNELQNETNGENGYTDKNYNAGWPSTLAYMGVGDRVTTTTGDAKRGGASAYDAYMTNLRYSGNDLTKKKYDQLVDYANQGAIVFSDKLFSYNSDDVDGNAVDISSFIYKLALSNKSNPSVSKYSYAIGAKDGSEKNKANSVKSAMTLYDCSFTFTSTDNPNGEKPLEFESTSVTQYKQNLNYNSQNVDGNNVLQYHFVINGNDDKKYSIALYTDSNGNGIYEGSINHLNEREANGDTKEFDTEKSNNIDIYDETDKMEITDSDTLKSGHTYTVTKMLPPTDVGLIPWKLELSQQDDKSVRYGEEGYTRIRPTEKKTIKVLQMNLSPDMNSNPNPTVWFDESKTVSGYKRVAEEFTKYNNELDDFTIEMKYLENSDWREEYQNDPEKWKNYLMGQDMLIIGFQDAAKFTNDETFLYGFIEFKNARKAIILTHDLVEDATFETGRNESKDSNKIKYTQSDVRYFLRDISGQIRKYYDAQSGSNEYFYNKAWSRGEEISFRHPSDDYYNYNGYDNNKNNKGKNIQVPNNEVRKYYNDPNDSNYDPDKPSKEHKEACAIQDNSTRAMLFWNSANYDESGMLWWYEITFKDVIDRKIDGVDMLHGRDNLQWTGKTFETDQIRAVNEGKITKYPFNLPETGNMEVRNTHTQNYQLDLEYDDDGDVLVWYNLAGGNTISDRNMDLYDGRSQDCRNNYYIYTKGNITYTGVGHFDAIMRTALTDYEIKLFINTMIAAYRSSASPPYIRVTSPGAYNNGESTSMYIEGDSTTIDYRIYDDTTNARILSTRGYSLRVYKGDEEIAYIPDASRLEEYHIPVSYADVAANGSAQYKIILNSTYFDSSTQSWTPPTSYIQTVDVTLMPMFNLR